MDHHEVCVAIRVGLAHMLNEVNHRDGIGWNSMIWPAKVVEQCDSVSGRSWTISLDIQHMQNIHTYTLKLITYSRWLLACNLLVSFFFFFCGGGGGEWAGRVGVINVSLKPYSIKEQFGLSPLIRITQGNFIVYPYCSYLKINCLVVKIRKEYTM